MQSIFSAPPRPSFRHLSVEVVRRDAALKTLCIIRLFDNAFGHCKGHRRASASAGVSVYSAGIGSIRLGSLFRVPDVRAHRLWGVNLSLRVQSAAYLGTRHRRNFDGCVIRWPQQMISWNTPAGLKRSPQAL
jgi:hypothetical protein